MEITKFVKCLTKIRPEFLSENAVNRFRILLTINKSSGYRFF